MSSVPLAGRRWELADVLNLYGQAYRQSHPHLPPAHLKVMRAIQACRTARLGGHVERCDQCGFTRNAYNSCRNRHCPKCQSVAKAQWLKDRNTELLPVPYFHTVFTLPHELNAIALGHKRRVFNIFFQAVSETLLAFAHQDMNGDLGITAILHTWDQKLNLHIHLHCAVTAGALSLDGKTWIPSKPNFLFPVRALASVFGGKFMDALKKAYAKGHIRFPDAPFHLLVNLLYQKPWIVYAKPAFAGPQVVLDYFGRYTHRIAISNHRITDIKDGNVTFSYRDRNDDNQKKVMTVTAEEFIRRFLLHTVPASFQRIRHFGFLANRRKTKDLARCRELLGCSREPAQKSEENITAETVHELTGVNLIQCPACQKGHLGIIAKIPRQPRLDSS